MDRRFAGLLRQVREDTDVPELFFRLWNADRRSREAQRLGCYVLIGLPTVNPQTRGTDRRPIYHNSLLVVGPDGAHVHTYHKTFLYGELTNDRADYLWAEAGTGFVALDLPFPSSSPFHAVAAAANNSASHHSAPSTFRLVPAICMDLNMPTFDAPFEKFELATFASEKRADIVVGSMAWLDSEPPLDSSEDESQRDDSGDGKDAAAAASQWEEVRSVISYWVLRLSPLIGSGAAFVCANRVGREGGERRLPLLTRDWTKYADDLGDDRRGLYRLELRIGALRQALRDRPCRQARRKGCHRSRLASGLAKYLNLKSSRNGTRRGVSVVVIISQTGPT